MRSKQHIRETKKSIWRRIWEAKTAYLLLAPLVIGLLITAYYPPLNGIFHAFFDWNPTGESTFVGLDNFKEIFSDPVFWGSIPTLFKFLIPRLLISVVVPLIMAEILFAVRNKKMQYGYRVAILLPMVAPATITMLIWQQIYDPNGGLLRQLLTAIGIMQPDQVVDWLGNAATVIPAMIFIGFPWIGGTAVLIYMAGLMNIGTEIIEASVLDGCNIFVRIFKIDLPMIVGQIRYFLVFGLIGLIQDYNPQMVLTSGGPGYTTYVPGYYMYTKAFGADRLGYASAVGVIIFLSIFALTIISFRLMRSDDSN